MELHKTDVNVESFIDSCVSIFHTPARGKDVTIKLELCDQSEDASLSVKTTDLISIDKFKMSQVLRNFMSNAMKFTPEGGTITVRACFTPDMTKPLIPAQPSSGINVVKNNSFYSKLISQFFRLNSFSCNSVRVGGIDLERGQVGGDGSGSVSGSGRAQEGILRISVIDFDWKPAESSDEEDRGSSSGDDDGGKDGGN